MQTPLLSLQGLGGGWGGNLPRLLLYRTQDHHNWVAGHSVA